MFSRILIAFTLVPYSAVSPYAQSPSRRPPVSRPIVFARPDKYIAGTPRTRLDALRNLKTASPANRGRWVIAYFSISCADCDRTARALNAYAATERIIAVAAAPAEDVNRWSSALGLKYPVFAVDDDTLERLGAIVYPTVVLFVDGKATGARCPSMERNR
ncbi:MAG: hypothetical protein ACREDR_42600 [Blastocatellia bacterium]